MEANKIKLLSNYQLFQLAQNDRLEAYTSTKIEVEFRRRNVSILELKDFQKRYDASLEASKVELKAEEKNEIRFTPHSHGENILNT